MATELHEMRKRIKTMKEIIQETIQKFREEFSLGLRLFPFPKIAKMHEVEAETQNLESFLSTHLTLAYEAGRADKAQEIGEEIERMLLGGYKREEIKDGEVKLTIGAYDELINSLQTKLEEK